jgi:hypothetical protein
MINFVNILTKFNLFYRMKHSNIIYDATINRTLIDNSLIKALETRKNRLKYNKDIKEIKEIKKDNKKEKQTTFEMSESHESKPFFKEYK